MCFQHCVDNFFSREVSGEEATCLDQCVSKFSNVNQRMMSTYVVEQSAINERRLKEIESQSAVSAAAILPAMTKEAASALESPAKTEQIETAVN